MSTEHQDLKAKLKIIEKENAILKKKFERCTRERSDLESLFDQTRKLLEMVSKERLTEEEQKQLNIFRKFVPEEFLQSLDKPDWLNIKLGDHVEKEMTVLFNDIRSFTKHSEELTIEQDFAFINNYLHCVFPSIQSHQGFVDKYIGDAVMALFFQSHEAIKAAIDMHQVLNTYNIQCVNTGVTPIHIGIGLHSGKLMLGIIGVESRLQGTVISPTVNLASRLESLTKLYGSALIVSEQVLGKDKELYPTRYLGLVDSALRKVQLHIYEILAAETEEIFEKKFKGKTYFEEGIKLYLEKSFAEASVQFMRSLKNYPEDKAGQLYLKKCANLMVTGVPDDWDGAVVV